MGMKNTTNITNLLLLDKVEEVKNLILEQKTIPNRKWVDFKSAIEWSGLSSSTLDRAIRKGILKVSKVSGKRMFNISLIIIFPRISICISSNITR